MKIALYNLTTTIKHGGVESIVWDIGQRLAERGHDVTLFGGHGPVDRQIANLTVRRYQYIARETWGRVPALRKSLNLLKLLERLSMAPRALPDLLAGGFDIVQVFKPYDFPIAALARARTGATFMYHSHGTDYFPGDKLFRRMIDGAFACSRYNASMAEARYHIPVGVAYNGFDDALFHPLAPDPALRARYAPNGEQLLLYVGRLVTFKGLDHLLDAMALLSERTRRQGDKETRRQEERAPCLPVSLSPGLPVRLLLAGDGPHRTSLQERVQQLGLSEHVQFLGNVPHTELPSLHAISDAFVIPSTDHETFCIAACEAMGCARPVIAARTGGLPEVVRDGETGFLVPPGDASALADQIAMLLGDRALRERMGAAAYDWSRSMFTWDRVIERILASYAQAGRS